MLLPWFRFQRFAVCCLLGAVFFIVVVLLLIRHKRACVCVCVFLLMLQEICTSKNSPSTMHARARQIGEQGIV